MKKWLIVFSILLMTTPCWAANAVSDLARFGVDARSAPVAIVDKALSIDEAIPIILEGVTEDAYETSIAVADPTADNTITIPDAGGVLGMQRSAAVAKTSTGNVAAKECYSGLITNTGASGAIVLTLPTPVVGMDCMFVLTAAQDVDVNAANGTQILTLTNATGDAISSAATIGNFVWLKAISTTQWLPLASSGTWTDVN